MVLKTGNELAELSEAEELEMVCQAGNSGRGFGVETNGNDSGSLFTKMSGRDGGKFTPTGDKTNPGGGDCLTVNGRFPSSRCG